MKQAIAVGFEYLVEVVEPDGTVSQSEVVHNLVPTEGLNSLLSTWILGATQVTAWFIAIYEGNFIPLVSSTAASLPAAATETTTYNEATRQAFVPGAVSGGSLDNSASRAEFTLSAPKTIYGMWMTSQAAKGSVLGVCASAVRFATPKVLDAGSVLRVTAGLTATSS